MNHENHERHEKEEKILYKEEGYLIQGAIFEVYKKVRAGFFESVYQECLERGLKLRELPFQKQVEIERFVL